MQSIRLKNEAAKLKLDHTEAQDLAKVEGGRNIQASRDQLKERQAERNKYLEDYNQQTQVEVSKVRAAMVEDTTRLEFEYLQVKQTLKLQSEEEAARVVAHTEAQVAELHAEAKLKIAELQGEAKKAMASAELAANAFLAKSRDFELRAKQLEVYAALAANKDVVLSHTDTADFNMLLLGKRPNGNRRLLGRLAEEAKKTTPPPPFFKKNVYPHPHSPIWLLCPQRTTC
jgi:hypothetical protein